MRPYLKDPAAIYAASFETVRAEARLDRFDPGMAALATRVIHACGMVEVADRLAHSPGAFQAGQAALAAGVEALRPGTLLQNVDEAMTDVIVDAARDHALREVARFRNGHGLGMSYEEPLSTTGFAQSWGRGQFALTPAPDLRALEGEVFELHPNLFAPGLGGAVLGEMMVVTAGQARGLLQFPTDMFEFSLNAG